MTDGPGGPFNELCPLCKERPVTRENQARFLVCQECYEEHGDNDGDWR